MRVTKAKHVAAMTLALGLLAVSGIVRRQATAQQPAPAPKKAPLAGRQAPVKALTADSKEAATPTDPRDALELPITMSLDPNTRLQDALEYISDHYNFTILIDNDAFKSENVPDVENNPIKLPRLVGIKLRTALRQVFNQANADFLVQDRHILIVPREWLARNVALRQPVSADLRGKSLDQAFGELSRRSGVSIVFSENLVELAKTPMTIQLENVPLITAVSVLADVRALRAIPVENLIYVTTPDKAELFINSHGSLIREGLLPDNVGQPAPPKNAKTRREKWEKGLRKGDLHLF